MEGVTTYLYGGNRDLLTNRDPRNITYLTNDYSPGSKRVLRQTLAATAAGTGRWFFRYQLSGATVTGSGCPAPPPTCPDTETYENAINPGGYTFTGGTIIATTVVDPRGKTTRYTFNGNGYTTSVTNALSQTTTLTREAPSNLVTDSVDHLGRCTHLDYDPNKNVTAIKRYKDPPTCSQAQEVKWSFTYNPTYNLLTSVTTPPTPVARTWTYGLDPTTWKTVTSITDPLTHVTNIFYNGSGQPTEIRDALTHSTFFDYDATTGYLTSVRDHLNNATTYAYDPLGRRVAVTDPRGQTSRFAYDLLNRVTAIADPLGRVVQFAYDPNSNLTSVTDPRGGQLTYAYNNMDQLQTRTDQLLRPETFGYDVGGNLTSFLDRKNQQTTWDAYDDLNRPTVVRFHNSLGTEVATLTYGYDAANRLQTLTDSVAGAITWGYDALDRLTSETTPQGTITYVPDDADRRTSMLVAGQPQVDYQWDNADRLQTITRQQVPTPLVATYGFDNANRRTSLTLPNSVRMDYSYDDANRLTRLDYSGLVGGNQSLTYSYDPASNRTVMAGSWARTILPDTISGASYDAANRQLTLGTKTMTYDNNGNLETLADGGTTTYTWDARNRLAGISGPSLTASFGYDAKGRRNQKTVNAQPAIFQYDGRDIIREVIGPTPVDYLRGLDIDEPLARVETSAASYYLHDALGTILGLTDTTGAVTTSYTYGPYGNTASFGAPSANAFQYTARENDGTALYYYRARYYRPDLQRFASEDPLNPATVQLPTAVLPESLVQTIESLAPFANGGVEAFVRGGCAAPAQQAPSAQLLFALLSRGQSALHAYSYVGNAPLTFVDPLGYDRSGFCDFVCTALSLLVCRRIPTFWGKGLCIVVGVILCVVLCGEIEKEQTGILGPQGPGPQILGTRKNTIARGTLRL